MVEISKSGSGEDLGWATGPGYSTVLDGARVTKSADLAGPDNKSADDKLKAWPRMATRL
jgi:hypothetical protein